MRAQLTTAGLVFAVSVLSLCVAVGHGVDSDDKPSVPVRPGSLNTAAVSDGVVMGPRLPNTPQGREVALARHREEAKRDAGRADAPESMGDRDSDGKMEGVNRPEPDDEEPWYGPEDPFQLAVPKKPAPPVRSKVIGRRTLMFDVGNVDGVALGPGESIKVFKSSEDASKKSGELAKQASDLEEMIEGLLDTLESESRQTETGGGDESGAESVAAHLRKRRETVANAALGPIDRARADSTETLLDSDLEPEPADDPWDSDAQQPYPHAFPSLSGNDGSATSATRCTNSRYCERHFFPTFEAHVRDLTSNGLSPADARELSCAGCMQFLCCERDHAMHFSYKAMLSRACAAHCRPLSEDFRALEYYHWLEWDTDTTWTFLREYLRAVTDANFAIFRDSQFRAFRNILYSLRSSQSTTMARRMRELPSDAIEYLAAGGGSQLYKAASQGTTFVIKRPYTWGTELAATTINEINANEVLRYSENPHLVQYFGYYVTFDPDSTQYVNLVYQYCPGGDMAQLWKERSEELTGRPDIVADLFAQMVVGLRELSINRIAHRDLKLDNIFIATTMDPTRRLEVGDLQVKVGDFDRAVMWPKRPADWRMSPIDATEVSQVSMYYASLDGSLSLGIDTVARYPMELATIRDNLMPPEAILAALGNLSTQDFVLLTNSIAMPELARLLPGFHGTPTVRSLREAITTMDPRLLEKYDVWQLGVMALQLLTGLDDPVKQAFEDTSRTVDAVSTGFKRPRIRPHLKRLRDSIDRKLSGDVKTLCDPDSPRAEHRVVCSLEQQQYAFGSQSRRTASLNQLLAGMGDAKTIYAGLENVFRYRPDERMGVLELAEEILLSDAISRVETNDRYLNLDRLDFFGEPLRREGEMEPQRNRWARCSMLSFKGSPVSPAPSLRSRSVRSSESAIRLLTGSPSPSMDDLNSAGTLMSDSESESEPSSPREVQFSFPMGESSGGKPGMERSGGIRGLGVMDSILGAAPELHTGSPTGEDDDGASSVSSLGSESISFGSIPSSISRYSLADYEGSPVGRQASMLMSSSPTISNNEDSPYSPLFYFPDEPWTQSAPPTVVVTGGDTLRRDLLEEGEMTEIMARAFPDEGLKDVGGELYPEVSYRLDRELPSPEGEDWRYSAVLFRNVAVRRVKHMEDAKGVFSDLDVKISMFTADPYIEPTLYGYLTVHLDVDIEFDDMTRRPDAVVRAMAYSKNQLVASPIASYGWVSVCDGHPRSGSDYDLTYKKDTAYCPQSSRKRVNKIRLKMLVHGSYGESVLDTWTVRLTTRTRGSTTEKCSNIEVVSPLNLLDLRWNTATASAMLGGGAARKDVACDACIHEWTLALRRLAYFVPTDSAFLGHDFECHDTDKECQDASKEIRKMLIKVPRSQRSVLLSLGPKEGCAMVTAHKCGADREEVVYTPSIPVGVCLKATYDRLQDKDITPTDPVGALRDFPKCPVHGDYPNVLPQYAPTPVYRGWHQTVGCDMCKFVVSTAAQLWMFRGGRDLATEDVCDIKERHMLQYQHGIYSQLKRIWPSHYYGNSESKIPSNVRARSDWPMLIEGLGSHARNAEAFMCALPWMERQVLLCRNIQESILMEIEGDWQSVEKKLQDPASYCQQLSCCPTE